MAESSLTVSSPAITAVILDPRGAGAVRVSVGGKWYGTIAADRADCLGLEPGRLLTDALKDALGRAADEQAAYRAVLAALGRRGHARRELERKLRRRGHPPDAVEAALERATRSGLVNDPAFAANFIQLKADRGRGPARLRRDLLLLGVEGEIIDRALLHYFGAEPDLTTPKALAARRAAQLRDLPPPVRRRRVLAYLARRGFTGRDVRSVVSEVIGHARH